ncbi:hypothetical protein [Thalassobaculum salexigens]|uniref:hypothetical protein n=1 Tax=Thalassobaculum salexigens TaxID=455360 RepID=UPI0004272858|nr:hypothetical protein [Thalassobaculum salexigens]
MATGAEAGVASCRFGTAGGGGGGAAEALRVGFGSLGGGGGGVAPALLLAEGAAGGGGGVGAADALCCGCGFGVTGFGTAVFDAAVEELDGRGVGWRSSGAWVGAGVEAEARGTAATERDGALPLRPWISAWTAGGGAA